MEARTSVAFNFLYHLKEPNKNVKIIRMKSFFEKSHVQ